MDERRNWPAEQRRAAWAELEAHILETLGQTGRLNQEIQDKLKLVEQLTARLAGHRDQEDGLPF